MAPVKLQMATMTPEQAYLEDKERIRKQLWPDKTRANHGKAIAKAKARLKRRKARWGK